MKLPLNYLRMVDYLANKTTTAALTALNDQLDAIAEKVAIPDEYMNPAFDMSYAADALSDLRRCAYVIDEVDVAYSMDEAIKLLQAGGTIFNDLPYAFKKYIGNTLYRGASSMLRGMVAEHVTGKLNEIRRMYSKALKGTGVIEMMNKMDALMTCMADACEDIDGYMDAIDKHYEDLRITDEGAVGDIIGLSPTIHDEVVSDGFAEVITAEEKKAAITATLDALDALTKTISDGLAFTDLSHDDEQFGFGGWENEYIDTSSYSGGSGSGVTVGGYTLTHLSTTTGTNNNGKPIYLWHLSSKGATLYSGSYCQDANQSYYTSDIPYTSWTKHDLTGTSADESCRSYVFDDALFITTEGGKIYSNGTSLVGNLGDHYLMAGIKFNGTVLFAKVDREGITGTGCNFTQLHTQTGSTWGGPNTEIFAFNMCVYNDELYMVGATEDDYRGSGQISKYSTSGTISQINISGYDTVTCARVYDGKLFFGSGVDSAKIGYYDGSSVTEDLTISGMGMVGDLYEYDGVLFATIFPPMGEKGKPEVWRRNTTEWSKVFAAEDFTQEYGERGTGTPGNMLTGWNGTMTVIDGKLYFISVDAYYDSTKYGPTYLYSIEATGTGDAIDLSTVNWLYDSVENWSVTTALKGISKTETTITLNYDDVNWATRDEGGTAVNANAWILIPNGDGWDAAIWEFLTPNQETKLIEAVSGANIKVAPYDEASGWVPTVGVEYGFMISGLNRAGLSNVTERSNVKMFTWS